LFGICSDLDREEKIREGEAATKSKREGGVMMQEIIEQASHQA
jgi:hypothetical protein